MAFGAFRMTNELVYRITNEFVSNDLVPGEAGLRQVTCIVRERQLSLYGHVARGRSRPSDSFLSRSEGLNHAEGRPHA